MNYFILLTFFATCFRGTLGVSPGLTSQILPTSGTLPRSRLNAYTWTDASTNLLYLYGGWTEDWGHHFTVAQNPTWGDAHYLADMWRFDRQSSTWSNIWGNPNETNKKPLYSPLGVGTTTPDTQPGGRCCGASALLSDGRVFMYGGQGMDIVNYAPGANSPMLSDSWIFDPKGLTSGGSPWTWEGGGKKRHTRGHYVEKGKESVFAAPGSRVWHELFTDSAGIVWLYGGYGYGNGADDAPLGDVWRWNPNTGLWAWMAGPMENFDDEDGHYGPLGVPSEWAKPRHRKNYAGWWDSSTQGDEGLVIFGGGSREGHLNDIWRFNSTSLQWTWLGGARSPKASVTELPLGENVLFQCNNPGVRSKLSAWSSSTEGQYLFYGGYGENSLGTFSQMEEVYLIEPFTQHASVAQLSGDPTGYQGNDLPINPLSWDVGQGRMITFSGINSTYAVVDRMWEFVYNPSTRLEDVTSAGVPTGDKCRDVQLKTIHTGGVVVQQAAEKTQSECCELCYGNVRCDVWIISNWGKCKLVQGPTGTKANNKWTHGTVERQGATCTLGEKFLPLPPEEPEKAPTIFPHTTDYANGAVEEVLLGPDQIPVFVFEIEDSTSVLDPADWRQGNGSAHNPDAHWYESLVHKQGESSATVIGKSAINRGKLTFEFNVRTETPIRTDEGGEWVLMCLQQTASFTDGLGSCANQFWFQVERSNNLSPMGRSYSDPWFHNIWSSPQCVDTDKDDEWYWDSFVQYRPRFKAFQSIFLSLPTGPNKITIAPSKKGNRIDKCVLYHEGAFTPGSHENKMIVNRDPGSRFSQVVNSLEAWPTLLPAENFAPHAISFLPEPASGMVLREKFVTSQCSPVVIFDIKTVAPDGNYWVQESDAINTVAPSYAKAKYEAVEWWKDPKGIVHMNFELGTTSGPEAWVFVCHMSQNPDGHLGDPAFSGNTMDFRFGGSEHPWTNTMLNYRDWNTLKHNGDWSWVSTAGSNASHIMMGLPQGNHWLEVTPHADGHNVLVDQCIIYLNGWNPHEHYSTEPGSRFETVTTAVRDNLVFQTKGDCLAHHSGGVIDCQGSYGDYGSCDVSCGGGVRSRTFSVTTSAAGGGNECVASAGDTQTQTCNTPICPDLCMGITCPSSDSCQPQVCDSLTGASFHTDSYSSLHPQSCYPSNTTSTSKGIAVSCCDDNGVGHRPDCSAVGMDWASAQATCQSYGFRLCTQQEWDAKATRGKGCNFDHHSNWLLSNCGGCSAGTPLPNGTSCDDGNPITVDDTCSLGVCSGIPEVAVTLLEPNSDSCPSQGYVALTEQECQHSASAVGGIWNKQSSWDTWPTGCFFKIDNNNLFFNTNANGAVNANGRPVCFPPQAASMLETSEEYKIGQQVLLKLRSARRAHVKKKKR